MVYSRKHCPKNDPILNAFCGRWYQVVTFAADIALLAALSHHPPPQTPKKQGTWSAMLSKIRAQRRQVGKQQWFGVVKNKCSGINGSLSATINSQTKRIKTKIQLVLMPWGESVMHFENTECFKPVQRWKAYTKSNYFLFFTQLFEPLLHSHDHSFAILSKCQCYKLPNVGLAISQQFNWLHLKAVPVSEYIYTASIKGTWW